MTNIGTNKYSEGPVWLWPVPYIRWWGHVTDRYMGRRADRYDPPIFIGRLVQKLPSPLFHFWIASTLQFARPQPPFRFPTPPLHLCRLPTPPPLTQPPMPPYRPPLACLATVAALPDRLAPPCSAAHITYSLCHRWCIAQPEGPDDPGALRA
jgi:hypothetical protein